MVPSLAGLRVGLVRPLVLFSWVFGNDAGILSVDPDGRLTNSVSQRYRMVGGRLDLGTWSTPVDEYGVRAGLRRRV